MTSYWIPAIREGGCHEVTLCHWGLPFLTVPKRLSHKEWSARRSDGCAHDVISPGVIGRWVSAWITPWAQHNLSKYQKHDYIFMTDSISPCCCRPSLCWWCQGSLYNPGLEVESAMRAQSGVGIMLSFQRWRTQTQVKSDTNSKNPFLKNFWAVPLSFCLNALSLSPPPAEGGSVQQASSNR